jgi:hypothetical protein
MSRLTKRVSYLAALLASVGCVVTSAIGLAGVLDEGPSPSSSVIAAASQVAISESAADDCPWNAGPTETVDVSSGLPRERGTT